MGARTNQRGKAAAGSSSSVDKDWGRGWEKDNSKPSLVTSGARAGSPPGQEVEHATTFGDIPHAVGHVQSLNRTAGHRLHVAKTGLDVDSTLQMLRFRHRPCVRCVENQGHLIQQLNHQGDEELTKWSTRVPLPAAAWVAHAKKNQKRPARNQHEATSATNLNVHLPAESNQAGQTKAARLQVVAVLWRKTGVVSMKKIHDPR
jgi:hypothetical protein